MKLHYIRIILLNREGYQYRKSINLYMPWAIEFGFMVKLAFKDWLSGFKPYNPSDDEQTRK